MAEQQLRLKHALYSVPSKTFLSVPINPQHPVVKGTLVFRRISSRRKRDRDTQSIPRRWLVPRHSYINTRYITYQRPFRFQSLPPLSLSENLFVSAKPRRGVCENAAALLCLVPATRFHFICAAQFRDLFVQSQLIFQTSWEKHGKTKGGTKKKSLFKFRVDVIKTWFLMRQRERRVCKFVTIL